LQGNPATETQSTPDGWKVVVGAAMIKLDGVDVVVILSVFRGFGKIFTVRSSMNDQSYTSHVDALLETMKLDKTAKLPPAANNNVAAPTAQNTGSKATFGNMMYTAPAGWSHQVFADGVVFKPVDLPTGEHLSIQIMQPLNFSGSLEQALAKSYDEAATMYNSIKMHYAGGDNYQKTEPKKSFNGWEYMKT
jgi:hypothetical protein